MVRSYFLYDIYVNSFKLAWILEWVLLSMHFSFMNELLCEEINSFNQVCIKRQLDTRCPFQYTTLLHQQKKNVLTISTLYNLCNLYINMVFYFEFPIWWSRSVYDSRKIGKIISGFFNNGSSVIHTHSTWCEYHQFQIYSPICLSHLLEELCKTVQKHLYCEMVHFPQNETQAWAVDTENKYKGNIWGI